MSKRKKTTPGSAATAAHTVDVLYLDTVVRYYKIPRTTAAFDSARLSFHEDLRPERRVSPERQEVIESSRPYAVNWNTSRAKDWIEIDHPEEDCTKKDLHVPPGRWFVDHHSPPREAGEADGGGERHGIGNDRAVPPREPSSLPTVDALEFRFTEDEMKIVREPRRETSGVSSA